MYNIGVDTERVIIGIGVGLKSGSRIPETLKQGNLGNPQDTQPTFTVRK